MTDEEYILMHQDRAKEMRAYKIKLLIIEAAAAGCLAVIIKEIITALM